MAYFCSFLVINALVNYYPSLTSSDDPRNQDSTMCGPLDVATCAGEAKV